MESSRRAAFGAAFRKGGRKRHVRPAPRGRESKHDSGEEAERQIERQDSSIEMQIQIDGSKTRESAGRSAPYKRGQGVRAHKANSNPKTPPATASNRLSTSN